MIGHPRSNILATSMSPTDEYCVVETGRETSWIVAVLRRSMRRIHRRAVAWRSGRERGRPGPAPDHEQIL